MSSSARAIILDSHSRAGLECVQALGRFGVTVDVASPEQDCLAFHSRYAARRFAQPSISELASWLKKLDEVSYYELIVPSTENSLLALRTLAEDDRLRRKAVLPSNSAIDIALDKQRTLELAARLGIATPKSRLIRDVSELGEFAGVAVIKPVNSMVTLNGQLRRLAPAIVASREEAITCLAQWLPHTAVQFQQYVAGRGVGIELLFERGIKRWHFAHQRIHEYPLTGGGSTYRSSMAADPRLLTAAERLLGELQWHGVAMVEFKMAGDGSFWLMEINPRLWGSLPLAIDAGVNFPKGLLLLAMGKRLPEQPAYRVGYYSRDLAGDVQWQLANTRADHGDPALLTRPRLRSLFGYLRILSGRESWDHFDIRDLGVTRRIFRALLSRYSGALKRRLLAKRAEDLIADSHRGVLSRLTDAHRPPANVLFLCYGNICRSPVAEHLARRQLPGIDFSSAGFHDKEGRPSPETIVRAAKSLGLDLSSFRSRRVTRQQIEAADLILVMDTENYTALRERFPDAAARTTTLGLFSKHSLANIPDPYNSSQQQTSRVVEMIADSVAGLSALLNGVQKAKGAQTHSG